MDTRVFCVYNLARGVFLSSKVTAADGLNEPLKILKVLVGGLGLDKESALWISPLSAIPAVPRLFPFDLVYLDREQRVIECTEIVPGAEFPPYRREVASALVLARQTLESTQTGRGDRLIICVGEEIEDQIAAAGTTDREPIVANARSFAGKNGKAAGAAASAVLAEPVSSFVGKPAEGAGSIAGSPSGRAVAMEAAVDQPTIGQAKTAPETEDRLNASKTKESRGVEPGVDSGEKAKEAPNAKASIPGGKLTTELIAEGIVEIPENESRPVINGQHGGVEDLFSNWVDTPSMSSAWMPRNPRPGIVAPTAPPAGMVDSTSTDEKASREEQTAKADEGQKNPSPKKAVSEIPPERAAQPRKLEVRASETETKATTPVAGPVPTRTAMPQANQGTTYTATNYGMWQASMPTGVSPRGSVPLSGQARPAVAVADKESTKAKETSAREKPAPIAKTADSSIEAPAPSNGSQSARAADAAEANGRMRADAKTREPLESPPGNEKSIHISNVTGPKAASEIAASANSQIPKPQSVVNSKSAEMTSVATSEKKPVTGTADGSCERLPIRPSESTERTVLSAAAVNDRAQTPKPEVPVAKANAPAQAATAASREAKVESKAGSPTKGASPKAQPKPSVEHANSNGKSKVAATSLGERFKRWLNPVAPVASDRRRAYRRYVPGMVAHYYTGGAPRPHEVADISMTGFYLLTEDRWMPETMIQMTLQKPCAKGERKQSITVLSKVVRRGSDGVAAEFVMPEDLDPLSHDIQPSQATDKFSLARFL